MSKIYNEFNIPLFVMVHISITFVLLSDNTNGGVHER